MGSDVRGDHPVTAAQVSARRHLTEIGAGELPRLPWMVGKVPHDDTTLIRYAVWRANSAEGLDAPQDLYAALRLLESARAEMDALEAGLLFVARAEGLTWAQIAQHLGVRSPQAAQQRFERVASRTEASDPDARTSTIGRPDTSTRCASSGGLPEGKDASHPVTGGLPATPTEQGPG